MHRKHKNLNVKSEFWKKKIFYSKLLSVAIWLSPLSAEFPVSVMSPFSTSLMQRLTLLILLTIKKPIAIVGCG